MRLSPEYIAGYFDADGTVTAHFGAQANPAWRPWVGIDACIYGQSFTMIDEIRMSLGYGHIRPVFNNTGSGCYRLEFTRPETAAFLSHIQPFVRLKVEQVTLALLLRATINPRRGGRGKAMVTDEEHAQRVILVKRISELNQHHGQAFRTKWVNSVKLSAVPDVTAETIPSQSEEGYATRKRA